MRASGLRVLMQISQLTSVGLRSFFVRALARTLVGICEICVKENCAQPCCSVTKSDVKQRIYWGNVEKLFLFEIGAFEPLAHKESSLSI